jgi:glutaredoxin
MPRSVRRKKSDGKKGKKSRDGKRVVKRKIDGNYKIKKRSVKKSDGGKGKWTIYSLKGCPYCEMAKEELDKRNISHDYKEFALLDGNERSEVEKKLNGFMTYPRIFDDKGKFIGGYRDMLTHLKNSQ